MLRRNTKFIKINIAFLGARGIPASYGGFDTFIEELTYRLAKSRSFNLLVYCRSSYYKKRPSIINDISLVYLPAPRFKAIESIVNSLFSSLHVIFKSANLIYFVDPANAPFCLFLRLLNKKVIVHTNGMGWKRKKWGLFSRFYYKFSEWLCARCASALITDNPIMKLYYKNAYHANSYYISYGAFSLYGLDLTVYKELGIIPKHYFLVVSRLEPENNTDLIIKEFIGSKTTMPLIVVGDSPYKKRYLTYLKEISDQRIKFIGRINNQPKLNALYKGAFLYIHGHEVGGTNPSLLRAMGTGTAPLIINSPFNVSVIDKWGFIFNKNKGDLSNKLEALEKTPKEVNQVGKLARVRAENEFTWESTTKKHIQLFRSLCDLIR